MKVIIAGTRTFNDYDYLYSVCNNLLINYDVEDLEIVSGCAEGADKLGEAYVKANNIKIKRFPANWELYGKAAGPIRNEEMAKYADACIVFWDGKSKGSKNMIDLARKYNLKLKVY